MANQFASGETYADGQTVNAARLNNTVNLATAQPGLITEQGLVTPAPADQILLRQASSGLLKRATFANLLPFASLQTTQVTPTPTSSVYPSYVTMGLGGSWTITPTATGKILVAVYGTLANLIANNSCNLYLSYYTGTAPAYGAPAGGIAMGTTVTVHNSLAAGFSDFSTGGLIAGLTIGVPIWIDANLCTGTTGGTAGAENLILSAVELP